MLIHYYPAGDCESLSCPFSFSLGCKKLIENPALNFLRNTSTGIADSDLNAVLHPNRPNGNFTFPLAVTLRVFGYGVGTIHQDI